MAFRAERGMSPTMRLETFDREWLPLGHAKLIDWQHLDLSEAPQGATVWANAIKGESVLVRTWCEETEHHFDLAWLAHPSRTSHLVIQISGSEPGRIMLKLKLSADSGRAVYDETLEFAEHPQTGLQGLSARTITERTSGFGTSNFTVDPLSPAHAEILEDAPKRALRSNFGYWIVRLLEQIGDIHEADLDRPDSQKASVVAPPPLSAASPPGEVPTPHDILSSRDTPLPISMDEDPSPSSPISSVQGPRLATPPLTPEPDAPMPPPLASAPSHPRLFVATNSGESWEIEGEETYIGRSKQCTVVLKSQRVSRKHASVTFEDGRWLINDVGAANGIWSGSEKIEREPIEDGSEYIIGDVLLTFTLA